MLRSEETTMAQTLNIEGDGAAAAPPFEPLAGTNYDSCYRNNLRGLPIFIQRTLAEQAGVQDAAV
jgi:hypothetical protein